MYEIFLDPLMKIRLHHSVHYVIKSRLIEVHQLINTLLSYASVDEH